MSSTITSPDQVVFMEIDADLRGRVAPKTDAIVAEACRRFPGQYAVLPLEGRQAKALQITINSKGSRAFPKGEFRSVLRNGQVYVAFTG